MEISGPRIGLRAMQLETVLAHVSQQLITCGRVRKHLTVRPEVGAVCEKDACPDLCGGREVTCVPTATARHNGRLCNGPSWRPAHAPQRWPRSRGHGATIDHLFVRPLCQAPIARRKTRVNALVAHPTGSLPRYCSPARYDAISTPLLSSGVAPSLTNRSAVSRQ